MRKQIDLTDARASKHHKTTCFFPIWLFAIKGIDLSDFITTLSSIPVHLVGVSMFLGYLAFVFRGLRWKLLIKPLGFSPRNSDSKHLELAPFHLVLV